VVSTLVAVGVNASLSAMGVAHDVALVALVAAATVAACGLVLAALDTGGRTGWRIRRSDAAPGSGEDTRTAMFRHVVEVHLTSQHADDAVVWQIADLARLRLRQLHGVRYEDDPQRATELLGPVLAEWVSHDRRHRYVPDSRHRRYSIAQLGEVLERVEQL
jgi:hypothetical protein